MAAVAHPLGGLECTAKEPKSAAKCTRKLNHRGHHHVRDTQTIWDSKPAKPYRDPDDLSEGEYQAFGRFGY